MSTPAATTHRCPASPGTLPRLPWIAGFLALILGLAAWAMIAANRTRNLETQSIRALADLHRMRHATRALLSERDALPALAARWGTAVDQFADSLATLAQQAHDPDLLRLDQTWHGIRTAVEPGRHALVALVASPLAQTVGDEGIEQTVVRLTADPHATVALRSLRLIQARLTTFDQDIGRFSGDLGDVASDLEARAATATRAAILGAVVLALGAAATGVALLVRITLLNLDLRQTMASLRNAQEQQARRERLLRGILDNLGEGVVLVDADGLVLWSNPGAQRIAERPDALQPGAVWLGQLDIRDPDNHPLQIAPGQNGRRWFEVRVLRPSGHLYIDLTTIPIQLSDDRQGFLAVMADLTERRALIGQLRQAQSLETLGRLAGGVAHDFNNLLAGILGNAELLGSRLRHQPELRSRIDTIITAGSRAATLTRQLLDSARRSAMQRGPVEMHGLIRDTVALLERSLDRRIQVVTRLDAIHSWIDGDAALLQNAFTNLAFNSRDAMPDGGRLEFATRTTGPGGSAGSSWFEVVVSDQGCGIPPQVLPRICEPFFTTKAAGKGTGLGLAAVHGTVTRLGGTIAITSTVGTGTQVTIRLPCGERPASGIRRVTALTTPRPASTRSILLAEDEDLVRTVATEQLRDLGFTVHGVANGAEAVAWLSEPGHACDLAILDLVMPRLGGIDTHRELRRMRPLLPILLWSGYSGGQDIEPLLGDGHTAFLTKPTTRHVLAETLDRLLESA